MDLAVKAEKLLADWKSGSFVFGLGVLHAAGSLASGLGKRALVVANASSWLAPTLERVTDSLQQCGPKILSTCPGSRPNTPIEDVYRIQREIESARPDLIVAVGAGSTIDAVKAAAALAAVSPGVHGVAPLFGAGRVSAKLAGRRIIPILAIETAASSASHLTKYSNVTDLSAGQKKLIIDDSIIPPAALFDYAVTVSASRDLTIDGAFDGISHSLEVYCGAKGATLDAVEQIALTGIELIVSSTRTAVTIPHNLEARYRLGLGTDLGGYSIMTGSTSGGHLTSFSLVDVTTHGRATAIMNPYYIVLFANAIERQLRAVAAIYARAGHMPPDVSALSGRDLGLAVAGGMMNLAGQLGAPASLGALPGFSHKHVDRALAAAKDPSLVSKLQAMPIPMDARMVDDYMKPLLESAAEGDILKVPTIHA